METGGPSDAVQRNNSSLQRDDGVELGMEVRRDLILSFVNFFLLRCFCEVFTDENTEIQRGLSPDLRL